ncbi:MAG: SDR family NAD(P)-dependent oxidoreductase [Pseudomonadota bacterium]
MPAFPIRGALCVITGAGSGIGAALARALAARGAALALADRDAEGLETTRASLPAATRAGLHVLDVTDADAVDALPAAVAEAHGAPADVLVNNAGVALGGTFAEATEADFNWLMAINLHAPIRLTRAFLPVLRTRPAGHVVNISSIYGIIAPAGQTAYSASKFGLRGFSEALRHELAGGPCGVTVVHPGGVSTRIARNARLPASRNDVDPEEAAAALARVEKLLKMPPDQAGEIIAKGLERRAKRVLVGGDARLIDVVQRLSPSGYWSVLQRFFNA